MVVSASYRTDIPGFYARWFERRYRAGFCLTLHPFDGTVRYVPLRLPEVTAFVFWTRNIAPFMGTLNDLYRDGVPFCVQYTITGYPSQLELRTPPQARATALCHELAARFGPDVLVWRYDPILFTSLTDAAFHRWRFDKFCAELQGTTNEVIVSCAQMYRKTVLNLKQASAAHSFTYEDPELEVKRELLLELAGIAAEHGMKLSVCAQRELLCEGLHDAACVDPVRLSSVAGREVRLPHQAHRKSCGCFESVDIGTYDTCASGCLYCYAVRAPQTGERRLKEHRPDDLLLWRPPRLRAISTAELLAKATGREVPNRDQMTLFDASEYD